MISFMALAPVLFPVVFFFLRCTMTILTRMVIVTVFCIFFRWSFQIPLAFSSVACSLTISPPSLTIWQSPPVPERLFFVLVSRTADQFVASYSYPPNESLEAKFVRAGAFLGLSPSFRRAKPSYACRFQFVGLIFSPTVLGCFFSL